MTDDDFLPGWSCVYDTDDGGSELAQEMFANNGIEFEVVPVGSLSRYSKPTLWVRDSDYDRSVQLIEKMVHAFHTPPSHHGSAAAANRSSRNSTSAGSAGGTSRAVRSVRLRPDRDRANYSARQVSNEMPDSMTMFELRAERTPDRIDLIRTWVPRIAMSLFFLSFGSQKFTDRYWVDIFATIGVGDWLHHVTGALQVSGGLLLLVPRTAPGPAEAGHYVLRQG